MKRILLSALLLFVAVLGFSQTTYTWVGGATGSWSTALNWSPARTTPATTDILVFDGVTIGTAVIVQPSTETIGQLMIQGNADITFERTSTSGTTTLTIGGGSGTDFLVAANSKLTLQGGLISALAANTVVLLAIGTTGEVSGNVVITGAANNRISVKDAGALNFLSGSSAAGNSAVNPFSTTSAGTTASADRAVIFKLGATFIYKGGLNPFGSSTTNVIVMESGSNFVFEASPAAGSNIYSSRYFGNVIVRNNASVIMDANFFLIENLSIEAGSTLNLRVSGVSPVSGNITNDGTFGTATPIGSSILLLLGTSPQTIGGSGTFNALGGLSVATNADVTLNRSIVLNGTSASSVTGKLNVGTNTISGTANFQTRSPQTVSGTPATLTSGSNTVTIDVTYYSGTVNTANVSNGLMVTGNGIQPNTYIIGTASGSSQITLSKPATITGATSLTITGTAPTFATANSGGMDASVTTTTKSYGSNTNYIFNAATSAPFSTTSTNSANNITFNAPVTLNRNVTANGIVSLTNGKVTFRPLDTLRVTSTGSITGTDATRYFVTQVNTTNGDQSALRIDNLTAATTFPIGSATNYLPATVAPVSASDFAATAFEGITTNGAPNGTPFTATEKQTVVDALWNISRINGTGDATLTTAWPQSLEGSTFSGYSGIGIIHGNGTGFDPVTGSGDNTANTATATFNTFSPFAVAGNQGTLPMNWKNVSASLINGKVKVDWTTLNETNIRNYGVERSADGRSFDVIGTVAARNSIENGYSFTDASPVAINYYRIKSTGVAGEAKYSTIIKINTGKAALQVYPNPAIDVLNITGLPSKSIVRIVNVAGVAVQQMQPAANTTFVTLPINLLAKGTYIIQVLNGTAVESKAFQKL